MLGYVYYWVTVCKTVHTMLSDRCLSCPVLSCLSVSLVYGDQTVRWIKVPLGTEVGLGPGHIMLDHGDPVPPPRPWKGAEYPLTFTIYGHHINHGSRLLWPNS